jgi:hypothetical protein
MEPNQEKDLRELSSRTEELLSRLNNLSNNLSEKIKHPPMQVPQASPNPPSQESEPNAKLAEPNHEQIINVQEPEPVQQPKQEYYSMPLNTHYLEKNERRIQTTNELGQHFMSTSSTSIFRGINPQENIFDFSSQQLPDFNKSIDTKSNNTAYQQPYQAPQPHQSFNNHQPAATEPNHTPPPQNPASTANTSNATAPHFYNPVMQTSNYQKQQETKPAPKPQEPLQPSAVFPGEHQAQTQRGPASQAYKANHNERTQEVANQIAQQNKEIKDRLQKYSNRLQISYKGDVLRLFALTVPLFALGAAMGIVNALGIQEFAQAVAIHSICLFLGIFASVGAFRLIEISELMRWIHNQILFIQAALDEKQTS